MADVFGDGEVAYECGSSFTCREADAIARGLVLLGFREAAETWLIGHAKNDTDEYDTHGDLHAAVSDESEDSQALARSRAREYVDENFL
ncbi:hypothetical protein V1227_18850 [Lentzea sp. DG1S-22]|uniref:hypothetical protein n=1 Tax=Lentzea sp. DG1S-22 TaxID=3108822 RepID=UPI002E7A6603|nr:hypothetical protein [Lentzea sp. DG1S-22]WVH84707.1 hypothetical protein V1227_18850 [Lentzea sp. DG1S-22]